MKRYTFYREIFTVYITIMPPVSTSFSMDSLNSSPQTWTVSTPPVVQQPSWEIKPAPSTWEKAKAFWAFDKSKTTVQKSGGLKFMTAAVWWTIFVGIGVIFLLLTQLNVRWSDKHPTHDSLVSIYKTVVTSIDEIVGYPGISKYSTIDQLNSATQIGDIISASIPFMFKQDILVELVEKLKLTILGNNKKAEEISQEITKYGFVPPDVMNLMETSKDKIPIITSLHTLETVKFGTALKLFSMLDTFLQDASQELWLNRTILEDTINTYLENGEAYISNYLSMCYLNPYEKLPDCNQINDFENYFKYEQPNANINYKYFSRLLELVEKRLETSSVASIKIDFKSFDPNSKNLAFQVTISTLAEDEAAFLMKGILNPHVFILSTLVNLLKQSLFVIGDGISVQNITVKDQNITIGNVQIPIKTSFMSFDLPLQSSSQREISDYLDISKY